LQVVVVAVMILLAVVVQAALDIFLLQLVQPLTQRLLAVAVVLVQAVLILL
jgi:hypothetical protein